MVDIATDGNYGNVGEKISDKLSQVVDDKNHTLPDWR